MRIEQLEYVAAVTRHGSLRRASEELHVSPPALSEAVAKLERELGVRLLDRHRSGARISRHGRELLEHVAGVLEAVDRLRTAAREEGASSRTVRVGTVSTATSTLLVPAVADVRAASPGTTVELVNSRQAEIDQGLRDGGLDLGLVNLLAGDDTPADLESHALVHGRPVVVLPAGHPLAGSAQVDLEDLRREPFVAMRAGYLMHRFVHRLLGARLPPVTHTTDGAELGKLLVAQGLGVTVLPDYSVLGDPLERAGLVVQRQIAGDRTTVTLVLRQRRAERVPAAVGGLRDALVARGRAYRDRAEP